MSALTDMLLSQPSPAEQFMGLLPLLEQFSAQAAGPVTTDTGTYGTSYTSSGTTVLPNGDTDYKYRDLPSGYRQLAAGDPLLRSRTLNSGHTVTLQRGPMRSLVEIARQSDVRPGLGELNWVNGWRSGASQAAGYNASPGRFAAPGTSYHGSGLAIDASQWSAIQELARALARAGWNRFSPGGEPWHWSYGVTG